MKKKHTHTHTTCINNTLYCTNSMYKVHRVVRKCTYLYNFSHVHINIPNNTYYMILCTTCKRTLKKKRSKMKNRLLSIERYIYTKGTSKRKKKRLKNATLSISGPRRTTSHKNNTTFKPLLHTHKKNHCSYTRGALL